MKYTVEQLELIIGSHKKWLSGDTGGVMANLSEANLSEADLRWASLSGSSLSGADLRGADLREANLRGANLRGADLRWADLRGADLRGANLSEANLSEANLSGANLRWASLSGSSLSGADLRDLLGNQINVKTVAVEKYTITYTSEYLQIGCQRFTLREWFNFSDDEISKMDSGALDWWNKWKMIIKTIIEISPAEPTI